MGGGGLAQALSPDALTLSGDSDKVRLVWVPQAIGHMSAPLPRCPLPRKRQRCEAWAWALWACAVDAPDCLF